MIRLLWKAPKNVQDVRKLVQTAINLEFATLPPYLYAKFSILPGKNATAYKLIDSVAGEEMIHMCLACNIMNAIGGKVTITPPSYPGPLPGSVEKGLTVHLYPFSKKAMKQAMNIETPVAPLDPPERQAMMVGDADGPVTIGEFYDNLDGELQKLPPSVWVTNRNQITDAQYFQGQLFAVNTYQDAHQAISNIVSEGEGSPKSATQGSPLDFQGEVAHYYRFEEIYRNKVLTKAVNQPTGYVWGNRLGVRWKEVYNAIADPALHNFSGEPRAAQNVQKECDAAFTDMVTELTHAFSGKEARLGNAIAAMFALRQSALKAFKTPLKNGQVAGPSFKLLSKNKGARS